MTRQLFPKVINVTYLSATSFKNQRNLQPSNSSDKIFFTSIKSEFWQIEFKSTSYSKPVIFQR